eukprot:s816_g13.t1
MEVSINGGRPRKHCSHGGVLRPLGEAVLIAAKFGLPSFRQKLLEASDGSEIPDDVIFAQASLKVQLVILDFWPLDEEQDQQLISASRENDVVALEELLQRPRSPNVRDMTDDLRSTPLHIAAENGHMRALQLLLEAGAVTDAPNTHGTTPLGFATFMGHQEIVRLLVEVGASKDQGCDASRGNTASFCSSTWRPGHGVLSCRGWGEA